MVDVQSHPYSLDSSRLSGYRLFRLTSLIFRIVYQLSCASVLRLQKSLESLLRWLLQEVKEYLSIGGSFRRVAALSLGLGVEAVCIAAAGCLTTYAFTGLIEKLKENILDITIFCIQGCNGVEQRFSHDEVLPSVFVMSFWPVLKAVATVEFHKESETIKILLARLTREMMSLLPATLSVKSNTASENFQLQEPHILKGILASKNEADFVDMFLNSCLDVASFSMSEYTPELKLEGCKLVESFGNLRVKGLNRFCMQLRSAEVALSIMAHNFNHSQQRVRKQMIRAATSLTPEFDFGCWEVMEPVICAFKVLIYDESKQVRFAALEAIEKMLQGSIKKKQGLEKQKDYLKYLLLLVAANSEEEGFIAFNILLSLEASTEQYPKSSFKQIELSEVDDPQKRAFKESRIHTLYTIMNVLGVSIDYVIYQIKMDLISWDASVRLRAAKLLLQLLILYRELTAREGELLLLYILFLYTKFNAELTFTSIDSQIESARYASYSHTESFSTRKHIEAEYILALDDCIKIMGHLIRPSTWLPLLFGILGTYDKSACILESNLRLLNAGEVALEDFSKLKGFNSGKASVVAAAMSSLILTTEQDSLTGREFQLEEVCGILRFLEPTTTQQLIEKNRTWIFNTKCVKIAAQLILALSDTIPTCLCLPLLVAVKVMCEKACSATLSAQTFLIYALLPLSRNSQGLALIRQIVQTLEQRAGLPENSIYCATMNYFLGCSDIDCPSSESTAHAPFNISALRFYQIMEVLIACCDTFSVQTNYERLIALLSSRSKASTSCVVSRAAALQLLQCIWSNHPAVLRREGVFQAIDEIITPNYCWLPGEANAQLRLASFNCLLKLMEGLKVVCLNGCAQSSLGFCQDGCCKACDNFEELLKCPMYIDAVKIASKDDSEETNRATACELIFRSLLFMQNRRKKNSLFIKNANVILSVLLDDDSEVVRKAAAKAWNIFKKVSKTFS